MKIILWLLIVMACANVIPFVDASENDDLLEMQNKLNENVMNQDFAFEEKNVVVQQASQPTKQTNTSCDAIKDMDPKSYEACVILHTVYGPLYNRIP